MMKKIVLVLLAVLVIGIPVFAGGGGQSSAGAGSDMSKHVVITYMTTGDIPTNETEAVLKVINQKLTEKVNAEIRIRWIEWTDYLTNYNLTLASQDGSIDLVGTATDWLDAWPNSRNGAFLPLTEDLLKTYAPKTWAQVPQSNWELCKLNGKIYLIPEDNYSQWTNHGFMYRGDWAKEAGLANGVHSWTDLEKYFQYVKTAKGIVPWDAEAAASIVDQLAGGWNASHTPNIFIEGLRIGLFMGESKTNPYKLSRYFIEGNELINFARNQKKWNDAGYWREDVLNNTSDTAEKLKAGLTGADQHHTQTWMGSIRPAMTKNFPGSDVGFFWFGEEQNNVISLNITHGAMAVAAKSKNPERALMVYDLIRNDPEIYRLFNYGIEGKDYNLSGRNFTRPAGWDNALNGVTTNYWWGRNDDLELRNGDLDWPAIENLFATYDKVSIPYPYGQVVFDLTPINSQLDNLSNVYNTYMPRIVFGKFDNAEQYVAEFRAALRNAGYEQVLTNVQSQLDAVYKK
ncbi:ABC transporter substrate-binding protein [Spirochaetia bacterium]|nr:ABC transporter substrate-binding protein [Spirochaetia bacterium]